jgi:hypothetical protein
MKQYITLLAFWVFSNESIGQNIGVGTATPHPSAALDVSSATRGLLAPRVTSTQRNAIASPAEGLLVYDTDLNALYNYNGSAWSAVGGNGLTLPYSASPALAGLAFAISNTGTAIQGSATAASAYGIFGVNNTASGFGIGGNSISGTGVYGFSSGSGVGLRGVSNSGYALLTSGNLRLTGGNTNPSTGAVLTSTDANGNAVWKPNQIAFRAVGVENQFITQGVDRKLEFSVAQFNYGNGFSPFSGSVTSGSSVFTAPVSGVYAFEAVVTIFTSDNIDFSEVNLSFFVNGIKSVETYIDDFDNNSNFGLVFGSIQTTLKLNENDKVYLSVRQNNSQNESVSAKQISNRNWFSGHLVFAD